MAKELLKAKPFKPHSSRARNGIALIFDLEGFSKFFNQPDVHEYMPAYLNNVTRAVEVMIFGGEEFWKPDNKENLVPLDKLPIHRKFLGDGMLYIWASSNDSDKFDNQLVRMLCNRLWNLKNDFKEINISCTDSVPVYELPSKIRFGIGRGTIYELSVQNSTSKEYLGFCINLASRLQGYCPHLGFMASARLGLSQAVINKHGYIRVVATKIKGFPKEIVIVDKDEYLELDDVVRNDLFAEI